MRAIIAAPFFDTYDKRSGKLLYTTLGLCVPIRVVKRECGLFRFHLKFSDRVWECMED